MKTTLLRTTALAACLLGALGVASAEGLHARIPFGFSANGRTMPAGDYAIRPMPNMQAVLLFENEATKVKTMVFAHTAMGTATKSPLTFTGASESKALTNIATAGWTYELSTYPATIPLKGAALALATSK